ncbi:MAG: N-acetyl-gamma-glutamyl-phosphate reductase [Actinomycetota bacterium]
MSHKAAVFGASGYAGGELVRLLDSHEALTLVHLGAHTQAGARLADVHPQLPDGERLLGPNDPDAVGDIDIAFLALPHGASAAVGDALRRRDVIVVDLGSDFRLDTPERYSLAYGTDHPLPSQLREWVYGLPELFDVAGRRAIASPGCYPTAVLLAAVPLIEAGLASGRGMVADCLSGVSGAGRSVKAELTFGAVDEGVRAYAVASHRHRPEIEMALDSRLGGEHRVVFTPHLVPMQRGLLATVTLTGEADTGAARDCLRDFYGKAAFVDVIDQPPQTRWVVGSNRALVTATADERTGTVIAHCAIDNLLKGAAGQAVQAANLALGLAEETGLTQAGWMP